MEKMTSAEAVIMDIVWATLVPLSSADIRSRLPQDIKWKTTTVNTFLSRLVKRGLLSIERREGRTVFYKARVTESAYNEEILRQNVQELDLNSVKNLIAALYQKNDLSASNITELKLWLSQEGYNDNKKGEEL